MMFRIATPKTLILATLLILSACSTSKEEMKQASMETEQATKEVAATEEVKVVEANVSQKAVLGAVDGVEIAGYCPVAYVEANKSVKGVAEHASEVNGQTYWFVNADAKAMFDANPAKYDVQYKGWCATGLGAMGKKITSDPKVFAIHGGKVYLFSNEEAKAMFLKDPDTLATAADKAWGAQM